jgi:Holliday junction resolvasome RuvABC ATP-dependent DNA helicase subunit
MSGTTLREALANLAAAARALGVDESEAAQEGRRLSAAVAESNVGAHLAWAEQLGIEADAGKFAFDAVKGRRYRANPTALASYAATLNSEAGKAYQEALVDVATAAALLGEPTSQALGAAQAAGAAQLGQGQTPALPPTDPDGPPADFASKAPAILSDVLARLSASQQALLDLNVSPITPGAIPGLGPVITGAPPVVSGVTGGQVAGSEAEPEAKAEAEAEVAVAEEPAKTVEEWLAELDALVGLQSVKAEIKRQTAILRVDALRTEAGLKSPTITRHLIFTGNPGTGKTTVARMVSGIYRAIGLLSKGQLVEVDRSELVAGYLGQTAMKTADVVQKALGGVLFIDEAYGLSGDQYGEEAINTLVKEMEDHRDDLVIIVAGYPGPMSVFISENPGLSSRFRTEIYFPDYTDAELEAMLKSMVAAGDYDLGEGVLEVFAAELAKQVRDMAFGNGRYVRNVFEAAIGKHAWRLRDIEKPTLEELRTLLPEDFAPDPEPVVDWSAAPVDSADEPPGGVDGAQS